MLDLRCSSVEARHEMCALEVGEVGSGLGISTSLPTLDVKWRTGPKTIDRVDMTPIHDLSHNNQDVWTVLRAYSTSAPCLLVLYEFGVKVNGEAVGVQYRIHI